VEQVDLSVAVVVDQVLARGERVGLVVVGRAGTARVGEIDQRVLGIGVVDGGVALRAADARGALLAGVPGRAAARVGRRRVGVEVGVRVGVVVGVVIAVRTAGAAALLAEVSRVGAARVAQQRIGV